MIRIGIAAILLWACSGGSACWAAARVGAGRQAGYPHFSGVQVLVDGAARPLDVKLLRSLEYQIPARLEGRVNPSPGAAELADLKRQIQPQVLDIYREGLAAPPWFDFLEPKRTKAFELSGSLQIDDRAMPEATNRQLAELIRTADELVEDPEVLAVVVANTYLFRRNKRLSYPDPVFGYALTLAHIGYTVRKIARETGMALPDRPVILMHNNPLSGGFFAHPEEAAPVLAHEIGHQVGLVHLRDNRNLMHVPTQDRRLNRAQREWIGGWLRHQQGRR